MFPDDDIAAGVDKGFILDLFARCCPKAHVCDARGVRAIVHRVPEVLVAREGGYLARLAAAEYIDSQGQRRRHAVASGCEAYDGIGPDDVPVPAAP